MSFINQIIQAKHWLKTLLGYLMVFLVGVVYTQAAHFGLLVVLSNVWHVLIIVAIYWLLIGFVSTLE